MKPLSRKARDARKPPSPAMLADALQDTMHTDSDRSAKTARREPMNPIEKLAALARRACPFTHHLEIACSCGTDAHNAQVDAVLAELGEVRVLWGSPDPCLMLKHGPTAMLTVRYLVVEIIEPSGDPGELKEK